nr:hypothetical protein [Tanacetum cinerariifolium]
MRSDTLLKVDPLNPLSPASESEPEDVNKVENTIEHENETVPASVHETTVWLRDGACIGREERKSKGRVLCVEQETAAMEKLVERLGNVEEKAECKKLKKKLEEARFSNTFFRMQNERVERDLYRTRVRAHEFYQEMIHRGFVFEERPNEAIDVPVKDEERTLKESRGESS